MVGDFDNDKEIALILGGSSGLGLATAKKLITHGMGICIVHRDGRSSMKTIEKEFNSMREQEIFFASYNTDVATPDSRKLVLADLKERNLKIRTLVFSVAKGSLKSIDPATDSCLGVEDINITMQYMAYCLYDWTMDIIREGLFAGDGRIIAFTSEGSHRVWKNYAAVSMAKSTLESLVRHLAVELAPYGIKANCIQAGVTETPSMLKIPGSDRLLQGDKQRNPFSRNTTEHDIANVVYLLCREEASWINGAIIPVDGGAHLC